AGGWECFPRLLVVTLAVQVCPGLLVVKRLADLSGMDSRAERLVIAVGISYGINTTVCALATLLGVNISTVLAGYIIALVVIGVALLAKEVRYRKSMN